MAKTEYPFRVIKDVSIYGNSKASAYDDNVLMVDTGGGIYLGNNTNSPTIISEKNYQTKTINNISIIGNGDIDVNNVYVADFSYEAAKEDQFQLSSEFIQAIYDNKVILVPLYPNNSDTVGYAIVETPTIDTTTNEIYFHLRNTDETVFVYGAITDNGGAEVYNDGISNFVWDDNLKTINGLSLVGSGNITIENIYITEFSYMQVRQVDEQGFRINQDLYDAIINKKIILVPYELGSTPNYLIMESPYYDSSDGCYFNLRQGTELIECYVPVDSDDITSNNISIYNTITGVSVNGTSIATSGVANIPIKTINNQSILGSGDIELNATTWEFL